MSSASSSASSSLSSSVSSSASGSVSGAASGHEPINSLNPITLLRCPLSGQKLRVLQRTITEEYQKRAKKRSLFYMNPANQQANMGAGTNLPETPVADDFHAMLVREDLLVGYPIFRGVAHVAPEHAIHLPAPSRKTAK